MLTNSLMQADDSGISHDLIRHLLKTEHDHPFVNPSLDIMAVRGRWVRLKSRKPGTDDITTRYFFVREESDWPKASVNAKTMIEDTRYGFGQLIFDAQGDVKPWTRAIGLKRAAFDDGLRITPYEYITMDCDTGDGYRIVLYGAYNAMGLIGSEKNGVAVLDNLKKEIVCDSLFQVNSGWGGPASSQEAKFTILARLMLEDQRAFAHFVTIAGQRNLRTPVRATTPEKKS